MLDQGRVPQVPQNEGQDQNVQKENQDIVDELLRVARGKNVFHFLLSDENKNDDVEKEEGGGGAETFGG